MKKCYTNKAKKFKIGTRKKLLNYEIGVQKGHDICRDLPCLIWRFEEVATLRLISCVKDSMRGSFVKQSKLSNHKFERNLSLNEIQLSKFWFFIGVFVSETLQMFDHSDFLFTKIGKNVVASATYSQGPESSGMALKIMRKNQKTLSRAVAGRLNVP